MIAEVVPPTQDLATKTDVAAVDRRFAELDAKIHAEATRSIKWMIGVFVPVWVATWGSMLAIVAMR